MNTVPLRVSHLKAALICAADKDIRYYMNAVLAEIRTRDVLLVSTDGHRLCVIRTHVVPEGEPDLAPAQIIIPRTVLKGIKPLGSCAAVLCNLEYDAAQPLAECKLSALADGGRTFRPENAKYPGYAPIIPGGPFSGTGTFNPYYLADFTDVVRIGAGLTDRHYADVYANGDGCALVTCDAFPEFVGALMPMRRVDGEPVRPDWLEAAVKQTVDTGKAR